MSYTAIAAVPITYSLLPWSLYHLDRQRHSLAAAQAERSQTALTAARAQRVDQRNQHARAARADRVTERDRAAVDVQAIPVDAQIAAVCHHLRRERLVNLEQIVAVERGAGVLHELTHCEDRRGEEFQRLDRRLSRANDPRQWRQSSRS